MTAALIFVAAGIGMDDAFVILRNYNAVDPHRELDVETRIARAMASGGASIFVTSLTDFVVFLTVRGRASAGRTRAARRGDSPAASAAVAGRTRAKARGAAPAYAAGELTIAPLTSPRRASSRRSR